MSKNGSMPDLANFDGGEEIPTDVHTLKGFVMAKDAQTNQRLDAIEKDLKEIGKTINGVAFAIKLVGGGLALAGIIGPALVWGLQHVSLK